MSSPLQSSLPAILAEVTSAVEAYTSSASALPVPPGDADKAARSRIILAAQRLLAAAKDPADEWVDVSVQIAQFTAARLFWEWGVFAEIPEEGGVGWKELADKVQAEEALLVRIGGILLATGVLAQPSPGVVAHTARSLMHRSGDLQHPAGLVYQLTWDNGFVPYSAYPRYFAEYGRKEPQGLTDVPGTFAYGHPEWSYYEMLEHDPARRARFFRAMKPIEERMPIAGIYDFGWVVAKAEGDEKETDRLLFVDVGGGRGHAIRAIHDEFPGLPLKRCMLQDRPEVIAAAKADEADDADWAAVQKLAIDFHAEQPVKGALVYWIRRCLHNYGDAVCVNMLTIIAASMAPDSRILLEEDVMDSPPHHMAAMLDLMMLGFGGKQRTIECWHDVVGRAGLEIKTVSKGKGPWRSLAVLEVGQKGA